MGTRRHVHREEFAARPDEIFWLLVTPSAIRQWWSAARAIVVAQEDGVWSAAWGDNEDDPEYVTVATIAAFEPPSKLVLTDYSYWARSGPLPFDAAFTTEFVVLPGEAGTVLQVTQDGFPAAAEADDFLAACEAGWRDTFAGIRAFLEFQMSGGPCS